MSLKGEVFQKLTTAVDSADETTLEGVQILALAGSAVKNLNEGTDIEEDVYKIGKPGTLGFFQATARPEILAVCGYIGLEGHDQITSPNYGNYADANGSILVYIPKHYYKIDGNTIHYEDTQMVGYILDRAFINGGKEVNGIFTYKYGGSNENGKFVSKKMQIPCSTNTANNPIGNLNGTPANNLGGVYEAVKTAGSQYAVTPVFVYSMLARAAKTHGEASTNQSVCAFIDVAPLQPKGNNNNALADTNDSSVTFVGSGYSNCALTGSASNFAKTTHNGQECGIADLNGNMYEIASGFTRTDVDGFLMLKDSVDVNSLDSTTVKLAENYDVIDLSDVISGNDGWTDFGNGANQVFEHNNIRTALGVCAATGHSVSGTTEFGNDGLYRYLRNEMVPGVGGSWANGSNAGVFALNVSSYFSHSSSYVGGRASVFV